jgi:hypothetical protein
LAQNEEPGGSRGEARGRRRLGEGREALAVTMDRNFPYVLLVNVAIADLQGLRDKAEEATRKFAMQSDHRVVERNEAVLFCFENSTAAIVFEYYCFRNRIPCRRIGDWSDD